jgi:hypothetical protein
LEKEKAFDLLGNTVCIPVIEEVSKRLIKTAILPTLKETGVQKNETEIFGRAV